MSGSDYVLTPNYSLYKPVPNADNDAWGGHLNTNADTLDALIKTIENKAGVTSFNTRTGPVVLTTGDVTGALTFTPYNATNPSGYQTAAQVTTALAPYAPLANPVFTGDARAVTPASTDSDTSIATTAFVQAVAAPSANNAGRNLVTNGTFAVAQRGAGPFAVFTGYTLDRWAVFGATDTFSITQVPIADAGIATIGDEAAQYALSNTFTGNAAAGASHQLQQKIENVRRLAGKAVTISFWAVAASGTPKLGINLGQFFGSGGSPSATVFALATGASVTLSPTWVRYSATITLPSIAGKTLGTNGDHSTNLQIWYSSGATNSAVAGNIGVQSATIYIWGVQLEIGSVATKLDQGGSPQQVLAECQRFYCTGDFLMGGYSVAGGGLWAPIGLPTTMRSSPTAALTGPGYGNMSGGQVQVYGRSIYATAVMTATGNGTFTGSYTASADL